MKTDWKKGKKLNFITKGKKHRTPGQMESNPILIQILFFFIFCSFYLALQSFIHIFVMISEWSRRGRGWSFTHLFPRLWITCDVGGGGGVKKIIIVWFAYMTGPTCKKTISSSILDGTICESGFVFFYSISHRKRLTSFNNGVYGRKNKNQIIRESESLGINCWSDELIERRDTIHWKITDV